VWFELGLTDRAGLDASVLVVVVCCVLLVRHQRQVLKAVVELVVVDVVYDMALWDGAIGLLPHEAVG
jgi:hypothetical protein